MQPVGKFYENDPHIIPKGQQYPLEILCLKAFGVDIDLLVAVLVVEYGLDFGETFNKRGNLVTEQIANVLDRIVGIFDYIVQKGSRY